MRALQLQYAAAEHAKGMLSSSTQTFIKIDSPFEGIDAYMILKDEGSITPAWALVMFQ